MTEKEQPQGIEAGDLEVSDADADHVLGGLAADDDDEVQT